MLINQYWVERIGDGDPIVFFHGFTGSVQTWSFIREYLPGYELILIDLPGHGKSTAKVDSLQACCHDLQQVLMELQITSFHLVGYSMGGRTALLFASYFPGMIKSLVLESASPGLQDREERQQRKQKDQELAAYIRQHPLQTFVDKWENIALFASQKSLSAEKKQQVREERLAQSRSGLATSLETMGTGTMPSCWSYLPELELPVFLITGEWDQKFIMINQQMHERLPNSSFQVVKRAGHAVHVEQAVFFGTMVKEFFAV
ncbi:2-succinyl-6-hydroxy-2,4-cyclohexadiene-1-carboxylate synthase [Gracilibacillus phocaeensis]|uniref:2-succinyl-6-hydroxy-2, 4-cyclohexadiene-1-carboxylate synthase n=1 Tax=Gracilibacillus phocaeensis TaxID=2042304 RepID=UPI001030AAAC|nr:2-succinyl-6-hydroxy-2,4-cyclohexadiene-1-carboxylate synthase [Gracilibacillus phocaeensis]